MSQIEVDLFFNPADPGILGVFQDEIHAEAAMSEIGNEDSWQSCVIIMRKEEYFRALGLWLDKKREICQRVSQLAETSGYLYPEKFTHETHSEVTLWNTISGQHEKLKVPVFFVEKFHDEVDMDVYKH